VTDRYLVWFTICYRRLHKKTAKADIAARPTNVRVTPKSRHS
jgi:hypothetical protein